MVRYNNDLLEEFCCENDLILEKKYDHLNRETIINGKCKNVDCLNIFSKTFRILLRTKNFCHECSILNGKIKSIETNIKKYGVENPLQNKEIMNNMKNTNIKKYGVENPFQNDKIKNKIKNTILNKYGVEHISQSTICVNKRKATLINKYGVDNPMKLEEFKNKLKNTNLKKYGVEYCQQNQDIRNKAMDTNLKKYGTKYSFQSELIKYKIKETLFKKYGVEYISNLPEVRIKAQETMLKKYGFRHASQNPYLSEKQISNSNKLYKFPSGKIVTIQGYENFALDILLKTYNENEIYNKRTEVPHIKYELKNESHYYYPDIFIPKDNLIIEVKSFYTYKKHLIKNILKSHAVRKLNYNYEIWIFDNKQKLTII
jgi:hypothetical protein